MNFFKTPTSKQPSDALKVHNPNTENNSYIESGTTLKGEINSSGNLYFNAVLTGTLTNNTKLSIGKKAEIEGEIEGKVVFIEGYVKGTVKVADLLILRATAKVEGEIITDKMIVEDGAIMNGNCTMNAQGNIKDLLIEQSA